MMTKTNTDEMEYGDFFLRSVKFYNNIDRYVDALKLERKDIDAFKSDMQLYQHISELRKSFPEYFVKYNIQIMQDRFKKLAKDCRQSANYTTAIGSAIGIEKDTFTITGFIRSLFAGFHLEKIAAVKMDVADNNKGWGKAAY